MKVENRIKKNTAWAKSPSYKRQNRAGGFTLAEVLVVLAIIGIACLVIVPQISNTDAMQAMSAGREVVSTFLFAQTEAVTTQHERQVVFTTGTNQYEVQDNTGTVVANPLSVGQAYRVTFSGSGRYQDVVIESADFDGGGSVWFDKMGAPYSGTVSEGPPLVAGAVVLRAGETRVQVRVEPVSGRVTVVEL